MTERRLSVMSDSDQSILSDDAQSVISIMSGDIQSIMSGEAPSPRVQLDLAKERLFNTVLFPFQIQKHILH